MSSFFIQEAEAIIYKHIDSYPLLKIQNLLVGGFAKVSNLQILRKFYRN